MEKNLYRGVVVLATALSLIGAILLFAGAGRAGLGLLGIALASLPFLMHLQTRQLGSMLKYRFTHLENKLKSASSTSALLSPSMSGQDIAGISAAQRDLSSQIAKLEALMHQSSGTQQSALANELRRESRMLRLTAAQLAEELRIGADR